MRPAQNLINQEAARVSAALEGSMMTAARMLRDVRDHRPGDLEEVAKLAGMSRRNAYVLARVATVFDNRGIPDQRLESLGSAKLDLLASHVAEDGSNLAELLILAGHCSQQDLKSRLQGQAEEQRGSMLLHLPIHDDARFRKLLLRFGAKEKGKGLADKEAALISLMNAIDALREPLMPSVSQDT